MKTLTQTRWLVTLIVALGLATLVHAADITGFTATAVTGTCEVQQGDAFIAITLNQEYPFGTVVRTGRNSFADLKFSENNTFRLLARTQIAINQNTSNPKLKVLKLETGSIELKLDDYPKDHKLQVETPTAVCGAVGTRFVVSFESDAADTMAADDSKKGSRENRFSCDQGEVFVASRFTIKDKPVEGETINVGSVQAGSAMVAVIHEGLENSYSDITVNRGKLSFGYGGKDGNTLNAEATPDKPVRFVCALEKSKSDVDVAAVEVLEGEVKNVKTTKRLMAPTTVEEVVIAPTDGAVVINKSNVMDAQPGTTTVTEYIAAAKVEAEMHSKLVDKESAGQAVTAEETRALKDAASAASKLRKDLVRKSVIRTLQQIHRNTNPPRMPKH